MNFSTIASRVRISSFASATATSKPMACSSTTPKPPPSCSPTPFSASAEYESSAVLFNGDNAVEHKVVHSLMNLHKSVAAGQQTAQWEVYYRVQ